MPHRKQPRGKAVHKKSRINLILRGGTVNLFPMIYLRKVNAMNGFYSANITPDYFIKKETERKALKRLGIFCGTGVCLYVLIQNAISLFLQLAGLWDNYTDNTFFQIGTDIILSFAGVLLPFILLSFAMKKYSSVKEPLMFERRVSRGSMVLAVVSGVGLCMAANIISTIFIAIASLFGFQLTSPEIPLPTDAAGMLLTFVRTVVVAAMAEELALRGYVLGHIREKYGDAFAVGVTAVIFAIMHGNLVQSPFALLAGAAIGYFTVKTGSLWVGIFIHMFNNFISICSAYIIELQGQETGALLYTLAVYGISIIGVVCTLIFVINNKDKRLHKNQSVLSLSEKITAYFFNIPMIIALIVMLYVTSTFVEFGW